ncbi:hypothetical protein BGZ63DRAFT_172887 [Mariannaea sp. PMI_226]|nr:hypothetical protein BGZ63DRAFT_172887 [Mariannaea sp. PMI_226]
METTEGKALRRAPVAPMIEEGSELERMVQHAYREFDIMQQRRCLDIVRLLDFQQQSEGRVSILVLWEDMQESYVPESKLHRTCLQQLLEFWERHGGRDSALQLDRDGLFLVHEITKMQVKGGKRQYLVEWVGYDKSAQTWEPESNLPKSLTREFNQNRC